MLITESFGKAIWRFLEMAQGIQKKKLSRTYNWFLYSPFQSSKGSLKKNSFQTRWYHEMQVLVSLLQKGRENFHINTVLSLAILNFLKISIAMLIRNITSIWDKYDFSLYET